MNENLHFSANALLVLRKRYLHKDSQGRISETPYQMLMRVSSRIAASELKYGASKQAVEKREKEFFSMMSGLEFMPNSPTLMNAGRKQGQLSACFVVPIEDSMDSIFDALKATALIHKTGGGTGFSFSRLRPRQSLVSSTGGRASGPVSFMKVFDAATQAVKQGGMRRGANMAILSVDHPDILEFIKCKQKEGEISNFNISVAVTDEFMAKVFSDGTYDLIDPHSGKVKKRLKAKKVFDLMVHQSWQNGEPGIIFIDKINADNPAVDLGKIESTNPCGELPLLPYESCNLGSINLARMIKKSDSGYEIDWDNLGRVVSLATRFLDDVIDANEFVLPEIKEKTCQTRKIGLGIMGWATMLGFLGIPYDSRQALTLASKIMEFIFSRAREASRVLAEERGVFPAWGKSVWAKRGVRLRNATLTTIAPTGSISIIAGPVSSGIEPFYALAYFRNVLEGKCMLEIEPAFAASAKKRGFYSEKLMQNIAKGKSIKNMPGIPEDIKKIFKTSLEIAPADHVKIQAAFQKYTDNAVSKTVNLPFSATEAEIKEIFFSAFRLGCKGITVYRDRSRHKQVFTLTRRVIKSGATTQTDTNLAENKNILTVCPGCGAVLRYQKGCAICDLCGFSKC